MTSILLSKALKCVTTEVCDSSNRPNGSEIHLQKLAEGMSERSVHMKVQLVRTSLLLQLPLEIIFA